MITKGRRVKILIQFTQSVCLLSDCGVAPLLNQGALIYHRKQGNEPKQVARGSFSREQ